MFPGKLWYLHPSQLLLLEAPEDTELKAAWPQKPAEGSGAFFGRAHCNAKVSEARQHRESNLRLHHCGSCVCRVLLPGL